MSFWFIFRIIEIILRSENGIEYEYKYKWDYLRSYFAWFSIDNYFNV
jgi:hypothetical protein